MGALLSSLRPSWYPEDNVKSVQEEAPRVRGIKRARFMDPDEQTYSHSDPFRQGAQHSSAQYEPSGPSQPRTSTPCNPTVQPNLFEHAHY